MPSAVLMPTSSKKSSSPDFSRVHQNVMSVLFVLIILQDHVSLLRFVFFSYALLKLLFYAALLMTTDVE